MRLDGSDDGSGADGLSGGGDDGRVPAHRMEALVAHLFDAFDTRAYRAAHAAAADDEDAARAAAAPAAQGEGPGAAAVESTPPHALFLLAPGGLTRRPSGVECFEMADCADPRSTGRMGVRGFLAGVTKIES
jgi:hypothetical protein